MRLRTIMIFLLVLLLAIVSVIYIGVSLRKAAEPPEPALTPSLNDAPIRVYGLVEPLGREVFVGPLLNGRVMEVAVQEGDRVDSGQVLCILESDVEKAALHVAQSQLNEAIAQLAITRDNLDRKRPLADKGAIPEFDASQVELQARLEEQQIASARAEVERRKVEIEKLTLRSPIAGTVYKIDVRVGELLTPQDYRRVVVGRSEKQVRLFVETFWLGRVNINDRFLVREAESLRKIGVGVVESVSPYVGARDFRTEDRLERMDTKYAQAILRLESLTETPIGMQVICERQGVPRQSRSAADTSKP